MGAFFKFVQVRGLVVVVVVIQFSDFRFDTRASFVVSLLSLSLFRFQISDYDFGHCTMYQGIVQHT